MDVNQLIGDSLRLPTDAISYFLTEQLTKAFPSKFLLSTTDDQFDVEEYALGGFCRLSRKANVYTEIVTTWHGPGYRTTASAKNGWHEAIWEGNALEVVTVTWQTLRGGTTEHKSILADSREVAEQFLRLVCEWNAEVRDEVLVFEGGCWQKSRQLHREIKTASFDNLILPPTLRRQMLEDFDEFFAARDFYAKYNMPWKRGALLLGPPGNGKTHTIKALINRLKHPCFYVKTFEAQYQTEQSMIREVFNRARKTTPCILIFEDLDSLITKNSRAYFLNELDGFASNEGIVVIATTNHPERLDPAILDRPSRFDRKYSFDLPAPPERDAYLVHWNDTVDAEMRLMPDVLADIVGLTDGFSYAYLKELWLSSMTRWISARTSHTALEMANVMREQCGLLAEQMRTASETVPDYAVDEEGDPAQKRIAALMGMVRPKAR